MQKIHLKYDINQVYAIFWPRQVYALTDKRKRGTKNEIDRYLPTMQKHEITIWISFKKISRAINYSAMKNNFDLYQGGYSSAN